MAEIPALEGITDLSAWMETTRENDCYGYEAGTHVIAIATVGTAKLDMEDARRLRNYLTLMLAMLDAPTVDAERKTDAD